MENVELLLRRNCNLQKFAKYYKRHTDRYGRLIYTIHPDHSASNKALFTGEQVYDVLCLLNYIKTRYPINKISLTIDVSEPIEFYDKLSYVILESAFYYLYCKYDFDVIMRFEVNQNIYTEGICFSPLSGMTNRRLFRKKYEKDFQLRHYRRLISPDMVKGEKLSAILQEITSFLAHNNIKQEICNQLAEALVETVGNAGEHVHSDCVVDIDITESYKKQEDIENEYIGVNAVVLNFSDILLPDLLKKRLAEDSDLPERYSTVKQAQKYHFKHLDSEYDEDDFYMISSFQHRISGKKGKGHTGGTGLTSLLNSLEQQSDTTLCYVLSGNKILFFKKDYMEYNKEMFVGFNREQKYVDGLPDKTILDRINTFLPGVGFNLTYVIKKENK